MLINNIIIKINRCKIKVFTMLFQKINLNILRLFGCFMEIDYLCRQIQ